MAERRVLLSSGVHLAVHEHGSGRPVLLLHAWGETHRTFDRLVPLLAPHAHLVVPDQRGVGASDKPPGGYGLAQAAADVVDLLDALGLASAVLVGTSSGGYVAQQVAVDHRERVDGLVLVGSPRSLAGGKDPFGEELARFHDPVTPEDVAAIRAGLSMRHDAPSDFLAAQDEAALTIPRHVWIATYEGFLHGTPPLDAGTVVCPTLVLWGGADELLAGDQADAFLRDVPGARLVVYEDTGHLVLWEVPELVALEVREFLASLA